MSSYAAYERLSGVRWSHLKHLLRSPRHYRHALDEGDTDTTSRLVGRALHTLVLEPDQYTATYAVWPGNRQGKAWDTFAEANAGRCILRLVEHDLIRAQSAAVWSHPAAADLILSGAHEQAITWVDPDTGLTCKALLDVHGPDGIADLKGTGALDVFERIAVRNSYHHQLAWYRWGLSVLTGERVPARLIAVEVKPPHDVGVFELSPTLLDIAEREVRALLPILAECERTNTWPGRYPEPVVMEAPDWMIDPNRVESDDEDQEEDT